MLRVYLDSYLLLSCRLLSEEREVLQLCSDVLQGAVACREDHVSMHLLRMLLLMLVCSCLMCGCFTGDGCVVI
jgi:hypothetical protein